MVQGKFSIKSGVKYVMYQTLAPFLQKKDIFVNRLESAFSGCKCIFCRPEQNGSREVHGMEF